jgi:purple acid phosphatase-like protein
MTNRTSDLSLPIWLKGVTRGFARKQSLLAAWTIILALLIQQSAFARMSAQPAGSPRSSGSDNLLSEAGSVFIDSESRIVRVTDSRDGEAKISSSGSSFNLDSSRFIVNLDGTPMLYSMDPSTFEIHKQGPPFETRFGSSPVQADSLHWSAVEASTIIGLESADSAIIFSYDTRSGSKTVLKDFSGGLGNGEAHQLSKSRFDDNHFAFSWSQRGSNPGLVVVWDRVADSTFVFYLNDPFGGVSGFTEAHLDRAGEALIVKGETTRVWRYRTNAQSDSVQIENAGAREMKAESQQNDSFDVFASISHPSDLPHSDVSPDGRLSIFSSTTAGSRSDVFIAAVNTNVAASSITWANMVNCSAVANSLQKTGGVDMADDAHATSAQAALSGDAYVEFTAQQADKERSCGLNNSNEIHQTASDINFAIKLTSTKKANVVENGVVKTKIKYKAGNVFRIAVESGVVNYYKNGSVFYTSTASPVYPLLVDASLVNTMAAVDNVMVSVAQVGAVLSISPAKASLIGGATLQFSALVTGGINTITWSATGGSITSSGFYTAPNAAGTYTVRAAYTSNPSVSASATVMVTSGADVTPPVISLVTASNVTASGVTITWNTDEASDTQVEYGTSAGYGSFSTTNPAMVMSHGVAFGGLSSATLYHYRVRSKDAAGNQGVSGDFSFTTQTGADTTPPVISGVSASSVTTTSSTIGWTTNEASDTQVEYGTTTAYGSSTGLNASLVASHTAFVSALTSSTLYHYRVKSKDAAGNLSVSGDFTFTTNAVPPPPPPPDPGVITDHNVYPEPAPPALPSAGGTFVDPTFGTTIMRVTDQTDGASNYNYYSYWPTFNLDDSKFFISCNGNPMLYRFDPSGFRIISKGPLFDQTLPGGGFMSTEDAEWSGTNANVLYGYYGLKLWAFDVSARTYTLIKDFAGLLPPGSLGQMSRSLDDNVFAFTVKDSNFAPTGYMVWQRDQNRIVRNVSLSNFDEVELDKTGRYLVVKALFSGGVDFQVVDLQTGNVQGLTDSTPDYSPGHSDNGRNIVVGYDDWNNQYTIRNLATPHQFQRVISFGGDWSQSNHMSMLGDNESWCVISNFTSGSGPVGPFRQEIFQASTDGTQSVRRLAHHHSVYRDYWDTPRADTSRDGKFVAFTSNWGSTTRRDVFIIKVPQGAGSGGGGGDTTPPVISSVNASSITASGAMVNWTTNEASDSQVEYGTSAAYGSATTLNTSMITSHNGIVSSLSPSTLYHYRVRSRDAAGNVAMSGDLTFTTAASAGGGSTQNVVWANSVNCTVSGNSLQKTSGRDDSPDAGAISQQQIASGDGYVEFTAGATGKIRFCGLTHSVSGTDYSAIDFAIKLNDSGVAEVRENNAYLSETTYSSSDVFRIAIQGGVVKYYKNGSVFYTSGRAPSYPLRVDAVFINLSGTANNAVISAGPGGALASILTNSRTGYAAANRRELAVLEEFERGCPTDITLRAITRRSLI